MEIKGKYTTAEILTPHYESGLISQITKVVSHPAFTNPIKIMPDCHIGKGCCIGFTMEATDKIVPNIIGVDIGCGVLSAKLTTRVTDFKGFDEGVRKVTPLGRDTHNRPTNKMNFATFLRNCNATIDEYYKGHMGDHLGELTEKGFKKLVKKIGAPRSRVMSSFGTLGGGNHFIELGEDDNGIQFITIHTGSRYFGLSIAKYHQRMAKGYMDSLKKLSEKDIIRIRKENEATPYLITTKLDAIKNKYRIETGTEYLEGEGANEYMYDMIIAQTYANTNREIMMKNIVSELGIEVDRYIQSVHNFISPRDRTIRKGAIECYEGEELVIPFNMKDGLIIGEGKYSPHWNNSAPHGAGRILSRSQAKRDLTMEDFEDDMKDVYSTSVNLATIDESPRAYKDADEIKGLIAEVVDITHMVKPLVNIKG